VAKRDDAWMPVLFMRLRAGRLWYYEGMEGFGRWGGLLANIKSGQCVPILGPGLLEPLIGSNREIARRWADEYLFPLSPQDRYGLPQVAQFLAKSQNTAFLIDELKSHCAQEILRRFGPELTDQERHAPLGDLMSAAGKRLRARRPADPHQVLASLPCRMYVSTTADNLIADALTEANRAPQVELCRWNKALLRQNPQDEDEDNQEETPPSALSNKAYRPSAEQPLVYHLFGHLREPDCKLLVLTEDNYFDFLIGVHKDPTTVPPKVGRPLLNSALLFLGFQIDDWSFRVLFRYLMSLEGIDRYERQDFVHVAVQIDPEAAGLMEPELARRYLEKVFQRAMINIYWGKAERFIEELQQEWEKRNPRAPAPA
jgi:hypothetical protein